MKQTWRTSIASYEIYEKGGETQKAHYIKVSVINLTMSTKTMK